MAEWLRLQPQRLNKPTKKNIRGAEVTVFLSPYDIPEAVRGGIEEASGRFVIQFKYQGSPEEPDEPLDVESSDAIVLKVGRRSHRLYRVELDSAELGVNHIEVRVLQEVDEAINRLAETRKRPSNRGRYDVAKQVILERGKDLVKSLVGYSPQ